MLVSIMRFQLDPILIAPILIAARTTHRVSRRATKILVWRNWSQNRTRYEAEVDTFCCSALPGARLAPTSIVSGGS